MKNGEYFVGDIVRLNSGSCDFRVINLQMEHKEWPSTEMEEHAVVEWYIGTQRMLHIFPKSCLTRVNHV